ncbi:MAG: hypothetical protein SO000_07635 [Sodaliphilus sp.]|nr:hypothetical protein [Sodaliphilus sp.]
MGKAIALLDNMQPFTTNSDTIYENIEDFCIIAYMCRVGILDRIKANSFMRNPMLQISIPMGFIKFKRVSMEKALEMTIDRLTQMVETDIVTSHAVNEILLKGESFYYFEKHLPDDLKKNLDSKCRSQAYHEILGGLCGRGFWCNFAVRCGRASGCSALT